ncbi:hypothetical protein CpipJ_CPIJ017295, partial [Culex quinquefasciatus]
ALEALIKEKEIKKAATKPFSASTGRSYICCKSIQRRVSY